MYMLSSLSASDYHRDAEDHKTQGKKKTSTTSLREKEVKMQKTNWSKSWFANVPRMPLKCNCTGMKRERKIQKQSTR